MYTAKFFLKNIFLVFGLLFVSFSFWYSFHPVYKTTTQNTLSLPSEPLPPLTEKAFIGTIPMPEVNKKQAYIDTVNGKFFLDSVVYDPIDQNKPILFSDLDEALHEMGDYIFYAQANKITRYNKVTKEIEDISLPVEMGSYSVAGVSPLTETRAIINFYGGTYGSDVLTYIYSIDTQIYEQINLFDACKVVYCGGPFVYGELSSKEFIVRQGGGDGCGGGGFIYKFNIETMTKELISKYAGGCGPDAPAFIGTADGKVLMSDYHYDETLGSMHDNIFSIDPYTLAKKDIVSKGKLPNNISDITVSTSNTNDLILYDYVSSKVYTFNFSTMLVTKIQPLKEYKLAQDTRERSLYKIESTNYQMDRITSAWENKSDEATAIFVQDLNGNVKDYLTFETWRTFYNKFFGKTLVDKQCAINGSYGFANVNLVGAKLTFTVYYYCPGSTSTTYHILHEVDVTNGELYVLPK